MPISAPGSRRDLGFTLVELMVVLVVMSLAAGAVVLAMPDPNGRLADEAARFAVRVRAAHDLAVTGARPVSLWVTATGYGFDERRAGAWVPVADKPLRVAQWEEGTSARLPDRARVTFDETGMPDRALAVPLRRDRARATVTVGQDGLVQVER